MKTKLILFLLITTGANFSGIQAQVKQVSIMEDLEIYVAGEGFIKISCDSKIKELIGLLSPELTEDKENSLQTNGFRIQVFMSNEGRTASKESSDKRTLIKEHFPEIAVYRDYIAPNWKLLAGDFITREEADVFKQRMLKAIPELGKEMYVVPNKINITIRKNN